MGRAGQPPRLGHQQVESPVIAVMTRFRFVHSWDVVSAYRGHRRILKQANALPGFLRAAFLIENPHTCYSLSLWADATAIPQFGTVVRDHVAVGNWAFPRLSTRVFGRPELWSTKWGLQTVSNNLAWEGLDLGQYVRHVEGSLN